MEAPDVFSLDDPEDMMEDVAEFVREFSIDPYTALKSAVKRKITRPDPTTISSLLHRSRGLDKRKLSKYLAAEGNGHLLSAYIDRLPTRGIPLDEAVWVLLKTIHFPTKTLMQERWLTAFARCWVQSNPGDNALGPKSTLKILRAAAGLMKASSTDLYDQATSVRQKFDKRRWEEDTENALKLALGPSKVVHAILLKKFPVRLTIDEKSVSVILRIPEIDPDLQIKVVAESGLVVDPKILTFAESNEAMLSIVGCKAGKRCIAFVKQGKSAYNYLDVGCRTIMVERPFMRWTFRLDAESALDTRCQNSHGEKMRYMFSAKDQEEKLEWWRMLELSSEVAITEQDEDVLPPEFLSSFRELIQAGIEQKEMKGEELIARIERVNSADDDKT